MHVFDVLGDPVRRRIVELLGQSDRTAGEITGVVTREFGVSQPAVSNQLRVLRDNGFARSTPLGARRLYSIEVARLDEIEVWVRRQRRFWSDQLDALAREDQRLTEGESP